ncbi:MAG: hypothetical protein R3C19_12770 [Planctomycetaceae bacterium]
MKPWSTTIPIADVLRVSGIVSLLIAGCGESENRTAGSIPSSAVRETIRYETTIDGEPESQRQATLRSVAEPSHHTDSGDADDADVRRQEQRDVRLSPPEQRLRLPDSRREINEARLSEQGIRVFRAKRLVLLTDRVEGDGAGLPALADALFERLEQHFGRLPEAPDGSEFQVTGHLIADAARFEAAGLMPSDGLTFKHGRHLNYEFWMRDQVDDYYRRHLLLHEFTHCFMTCECGMTDTPDAWYIEGMAEYFATHSLISTAEGEEAVAHFGVMPAVHSGFEGWARIFELRRIFDSRPGSEMRTLNIPALDDARLLSVPGVEEDSRYAWWWALCWMIHEHPFYRKHLAAELKTTRRHADFRAAVTRFEGAFRKRWTSDWLLFAESLIEGFDTDRSFAWHADRELSVADVSANEPATVTVRADRGWQDSGVSLSAGESVRLQCDGDFFVANDPQPWRSEPQGVTVEYVHGAPLGQVVAILVSADGSRISNRAAIARDAVVTAPFASRLWLQINDSAASRADNSGSVSVSISRAPDGV